MSKKQATLDAIDKTQLVTLKYVDKLLMSQPIWRVIQAIEEDIKDLENRNK